MVFLGTPFRGAGGLDQAEMIRAAQSQYEEDRVHGEVLGILAAGNESLTDLTTYFFETRQGKSKASIASSSSRSRAMSVPSSAGVGCR